MPILGFKKLSRQLSRLGAAAGGKALRNAANRSMLPALKAARLAAPVASPPYTYEGHAPVDPYPRKTYKGRLVTPGFARRSVARRSFLSRDKKTASIIIGVRPEAFYAISFGEFGNSRQAAAPWLEPSFRSSIGKINNLLRRFLKANLDKAARK